VKIAIETQRWSLGDLKIGHDQKCRAHVGENAIPTSLKDPSKDEG
jgi:hypothetical protein